MTDTGIAIADLERRSGVPARRLRYWTKTGILPRPGAGRYAAYPAAALDLALKARALYERGLGLGEIKRALSPGEGRAEAVPGDGQAAAPTPPAGALKGHVSVEVAPGVRLVADAPLGPGGEDALRRAAVAAWAVLAQGRA